MRIVVLGAGYAGLTLVRRLEDRLPADCELVLVNDAPSHLVQHEVHRVVRHPSVADAIRVPLDEVVRRASVVVDRVVRVDREARRVQLADDDPIDYDYAAVCIGAETAFHGLPGVEEHGQPLKSVADARAIRDDFLRVCEADGVAVVGGAGLSGVQVAGELAALADERDADADVVLLEQLDAVAPTFPESFSRAVHDELVARGVDVRTNAAVSAATPHVLEFDDRESLAYDQLVWTGGIAGRGAMAGDRPVVRQDLRLDAHTFALGDAARVVDADGEAVPASASAAIREAKAAAANLARLVEHDRSGADDFAPRLEPYRFDVPGWIVSVGDGAVAQVGPTVLTGGPARALKATVGAGHLSSIGAVTRAVDLVDEELG